MTSDLNILYILPLSSTAFNIYEGNNLAIYSHCFTISRQNTHNVERLVTLSTQ